MAFGFLDDITDGRSGENLDIQSYTNNKTYEVKNKLQYKGKDMAYRA